LGLVIAVRWWGAIILLPDRLSGTIWH